VAEELARRLSAGTVVALYGPIGAGKTTLVKALARALGIEDPITSPSFTLIHEHDGPIPLYHIDLYRLDSANEVSELALGEYFDGAGVSVVEWAERAEQFLPERTVRIVIRIDGTESRTISVGNAAEFREEA
jgi:tRNA threonylcarbamoyladenosine biosynthesis protein TsaE